MPETQCSRTVRLVNAQGFHLRPAKLFVELASKFGSTIEVIKDDVRIDGKSILSILTLAAPQGALLSLVAQGADAQAAVDALATLIESGFDEAQVVYPASE